MSKRASRFPVLGDWHLWSEVKRTVDPLRPEKPTLAPNRATLPIPAPPPPFIKPDWAHKGNARTPAGPAEGNPNPHKTQFKPQFPPGRVIEPRVKRHVARGRIEIDATIDLHGLRQNEAHAALSRFVTARVARGDRTVLVITGKGQIRGDDGMLERGILRTMLPAWLSEPGLAPFIAGWDVAARHHGGAGAYYVRLRVGTPRIP